MKKTISMIMLSAIFFTACNDASDHAAHTEHAPAAQKSEEPASHNESAEHAATDDSKVKTVSVTYKELNNQTAQFVNALMTDYLKIKSALVDGNEKQASKSAVTLNDHLKSFDKSYFTTAQKKEFDAIEQNLLTSSAEIATQYLDEQRKSFKTLSDNIYVLAKNFATGQTVYKEYCPMYEGGASWLSTEKEIRNPYYGDKMMKCGTVKEVIE